VPRVIEWHRERNLRHVAITALVAHAINAQAELEAVALRQAAEGCDATTMMQQGVTRKPAPSGSRPRVNHLADLMVGQPPSTAYRSATIRGSMIRKLRSSGEATSSFIRPLRGSTSREGDAVRMRRLVAFSPEYRHIKLASTDLSVFDDVSSRLEQSGITVVDETDAELAVPLLVLLCPSVFDNQQLLSRWRSHHMHGSKGRLLRDLNGSKEKLVGTLMNIKGIGRVPVPSKGLPLDPRLPPRAKFAPEPPRARFAPERGLQAVSTATQPDSRPCIYLYSTERTFASYMSACPPDLKGVGFFNHLFAKWPASWALQEAAISQIAQQAKVEDLAHQPDSIKRAKTAMGALGIRPPAAAPVARAWCAEGWKSQSRMGSQLLQMRRRPSREHPSDAPAASSQSKAKRPEWLERAAATAMQAAWRGKGTRKRKYRRPRNSKETMMELSGGLREPPVSRAPSGNPGNDQGAHNTLWSLAV